MLVGRERELEIVDTRVSQLTTSGGSVVLVRGEAGVGKSALVRAIAARHAQRCRVLTGWCDDLTTPEPLGPFWDVAQESAPIEESLSSGDRQRLWHDTMRLLSDPARPTILVIEDTHWADEATLDTIKYLGRRIARTNALLVLTYRDGEVDADHPLRRVIGELPSEHLARIQLDCLAPDDVASLLTGTHLALTEVLELTGGNPLFVTELVAAEGSAVPTSIQDAVLARVAKLSPTARQVLHLTSVIPGMASRGLIDTIAGPSHDAVAECVRQGLLRTDAGTVMFHHELTRRAVEASLADGERVTLNRRVLEALAGQDCWAQLVHHAVQACDDAAIAALAPRAARSALAIASHREAVAHFRTLEPHLDAVPASERADVVEDWARSEAAVVSHRAAEVTRRAIDLRRTVGDDFALARVLTFAVRAYQTAGQPDEAEAAVTEAIRLLESRERSAELGAALLARAWLHIGRGDNDPLAVRLLDRTIELAGEFEDEATLINALILKGAVGVDADGRLQTELAAEALARAQAAGLHDEEAYALTVLSAAAADERDIERAADLARRASDTAVRHELPYRELRALAQHSEILLWRGQWAAAEDLAVEALGLQPEWSLAVRVLATIQMRRGRDDAPALLERAWFSAVATDELHHVDPAAAAIAEHLWLSGASDTAAVARIHDAFERGVRSDSPWPSAALVFWMWKLGVGEATPVGRPEFYSPIMEGAWEKAAEFWRIRSSPYDRALALMHGDATAQLEALDIFEALGADATADRLRRELKDAGLRVPRGRARATRQNEAGLTARQSEVLTLLAEGFSNAEIADRLFISLRTVENHVSAVLMKLGAPTRSAAVKEALARNLVSVR